MINEIKLFCEDENRSFDKDSIFYIYNVADAVKLFQYCLEYEDNTPSMISNYKEWILFLSEYDELALIEDL